MNIQNTVDHLTLNKLSNQELIEILEKSTFINNDELLDNLLSQLPKLGPTEEQLLKYPQVKRAWEEYLIIAHLHGINN